MINIKANPRNAKENCGKLGYSGQSQNVTQSTNLVFDLYLRYEWVLHVGILRMYSA